MFRRKRKPPITILLVQGEEFYVVASTDEVRTALAVADDECPARFNLASTGKPVWVREADVGAVWEWRA